MYSCTVKCMGCAATPMVIHRIMLELPTWRCTIVTIQIVCKGRMPKKDVGGAHCTVQY